MTTEPAIAGSAAAALSALTPAQVNFLRALPKAELHAHLNGSIPLPVLQDLARAHVPAAGAPDVPAGLAILQAPVLAELHDFFALFPAIYALTSTPEALARAARAVLDSFLAGPHPQCTYLELRSTPRATPAMSREQYLRTVLEEVDRFPGRAALIVSVDRRMDDTVAAECVALAAALRVEGRAVVGVDLCGDPLAGDMTAFQAHFAAARAAGLGVTLHIAETTQNTAADTHALLAYTPTRLGHATFLDDAAKDIVLARRTAIELCLSSNLLCRTVARLEDHHIRFYLERGHPIAICTDDTLPFRTSLLGEYALLLAPAPLGLELSEDEVTRIAAMSMDARFVATTEM